MFRVSPDEVDRLLREGLRSVPVPEPSAEFDSNIRARLRRTEPPWRIFWESTRLFLAPAACSLAVTLALLICVGSGRPVGTMQVRPRSASDIALDPRTDRSRSIEQELDQLDGDTPSLGHFESRRRKTGAESNPPVPPARRRESGLRSVRLDSLPI